MVGSDHHFRPARSNACSDVRLLVKYFEAQLDKVAIFLKWRLGLVWHAYPWNSITWDSGHSSF